MREFVRELTTRRFGVDVELDVFRFSMDEIKLWNPDFPVEGDRPGRRVMEANIESYVEWITGVLEERSTDAVREMVGTTHRYALDAVYMNGNNVGKLADCVHPIDWMNYAPTKCDELADDEVGIELSAVIRRRS